MKKRAAAKKPARKSAPKKSTKTVKAEKPEKPVRTQERASGGKYTPTAIQGIGWAPFRYPA
jgi:hypothetical protein